MNMLIIDENAAGELGELGGEADFPVENNRLGKSAQIRSFLKKAPGYAYCINVLVRDSKL